MYVGKYVCTQITFYRYMSDNLHSVKLKLILKSISVKVV